MKKVSIFEFYLLLIAGITGYFWYVGQALNGIYILLTIALLTLIVLKSIVYPVTAIAFITFIESIEGTIVSLPISIYLAVGLITLLALIIKKKRRQTSWSWIGILAVGTALIFSGYDRYQFSYAWLMVAITIALLLIYYVVYFAMEQEDAYRIAMLIKWAGILIVFQVGVYYFQNDNFLQLIQSKNLDIGWAKSNQVGIALLATIPISLYAYFTQKNMYLFNGLVFIAQVGAMILTYSRGAVLACLVVLLIAFIGFFFLQQKRYRIWLLFLMILGCAGCVVYLAKDNLQTIFDVTFRLGLNDSGRFSLFQDAWQVFKTDPMFGEGFVLGEFGERSITYYHSTPLQFLATTGMFGFGAWCLHCYYKYKAVLQHRNLLGWYGLLSFLGVGLYGLIDVTFFTFPYTLFLILLLLMVENNQHNHRVQMQESAFFIEE